MPVDIRMSDTCKYADYEPALIHDEEKRKKYPLQFYPGRHKYFMQSQFTNVPELVALILVVVVGGMGVYSSVSEPVCGVCINIGNEYGIADLPAAIEPGKRR